MSLLSASSFKKASIIELKGLVLDTLFRLGFDVTISPLNIRCPGALGLYSEVGILNDKGVVYLQAGEEKIEVVFANIGPHFGRSDLEALELIKFLSEVRVVVGAGYNLGTAYLRPTRI